MSLPLHRAFEYLAKSQTEDVAHGTVPWPAKGGFAEFVIDLNADSRDLSAAEKRNVVLQWSQWWHPDTWAKPKYKKERSYSLASARSLEED